MVKISNKILIMKELSQIKDYASKNSVPIMFDEGIEFIIDYIKKNLNIQPHHFAAMISATNS